MTSSTSSHSLPAAGRDRRTTGHPLIAAAAGTAVVALAVNIALATGTVSALDVGSGYDPLALPSVAAATVAGVLAAALLLAVLRRRSRRPRRTFTALIVVGALLSLGGPLSLLMEPRQYPQATAGVVALTALLHVTTAAAVLLGLPRTLRGQA